MMEDEKRARELAGDFKRRADSMNQHAVVLPPNKRKGVKAEAKRFGDAAKYLGSFADALAEFRQQHAQAVPAAADIERALEREA
jgi:hypothetical protein